MRLKEDTSSWHSNGIIHRDNRHDHSERFYKLHSKRDTKRWCRGKVGVEHEYHRYLRGWHYHYVEARCVNCNKLSFSKKSKDKSIPLHIEVDSRCDCKWDNYEYYHNVEVRHG